MTSKTQKKFLAISVALPVLLLATGCQTSPTEIHLTTYDEAGQAQRHFAGFSRASYHRAADGLIEMVLHAQQPSRVDPTQTITQIVYIKELWNPHPGITFVESTQINARVRYAILTPPTGVRYDGSAFVTYDINKRTGLLAGKFESGQLIASYRMGSADAPFVNARFTGTFRATENSSDVINTVQQLESLFSQRIGE